MKFGITGHRRLDDASAWRWTAEVIGRELDGAPRPLAAVTSLAIGADQILARLVLERGGAVHAVLPYAGIERSFDSLELPSYRELVARARVEVLDTPGTDEDAYLAAGRRVVDSSDQLIAVWDGKPAKGKGGTADIVAYARSRGIPTLHVNPIDRTVTRVV